MNFRTVARAVALTVFAGSTILAQAPAAPAAPQPSSAAADLPLLPYETMTLPNGLKVILSQDRRLPVVAVNIWYHVGPANELPGRTGFAHLFEHMMFQGSKHVARGQHFKLLEAAGTRGGSYINGTTDFDRTNYFETVPSTELALALWLESDRMGYLLEKLDQSALDNQKDVVRNERRLSLENPPYGVVDEAVYRTLYPQGHPYHAYVIGSHADIQAAQLDDVRQFFRQYYAPNNASLAIVGDFDIAEAKQLVQKYFGALKSGPPIPKITAETPPITAEKRLTVTDRIELPRLYMAWLTPAIFKPGDADADVAANILGGGKSSRLFKKLVYERQIAQNVRASQESLILGSKFNIEVTARPGHSLEEIETAVNEELARLRSEGPDAPEMERARNTIESQMIERLETFGGFGGKADRLNSYEHYLGNPGYLQQDILRYRQVTAAAVKDFAAKYLQNEHRLVVQAVPGEKKLAPEPPSSQSTQGAAKPSAAAESSAPGINADEPWRGEPPKGGAARPVQIAAPETFRLSNGLTVILSQRPGLPVVAANLIVRSGSDANPLARPGLANFTATMLIEGTATRKSLAIADEVARLGGRLTAGSSMDATQVQGFSLTKNFGGMLDLLADVVLHPSFPEEEVGRQRASRLSQLLSLKDDPGSVADRIMLASLYGVEHPYGLLEIGTEASNKSISRTDIQSFWQTHFVPSNAALVVAGDISRADVQRLAEGALGSWRGPAAPTPTLAPPQPAGARVIIVDKPGAPQTELRVGTIGTSRKSPDYTPAVVMNAALGGMVSSRINLNLREDKGYTYGAFSNFRFNRTEGPFIVTSAVRTDVTAPALTEVFKELRAIAQQPIPDAELSQAKELIVRSLPTRFETSTNAAASYAVPYIYDLGLDYWSGYPKEIATVNAAAAQAAAKKYLQPERMIAVAVGDRAKIQPELEKLNFGAIEIRNADADVVTGGAPREPAKAIR
jgi:zinc protease